MNRGTSSRLLQIPRRAGSKSVGPLGRSWRPRNISVSAVGFVAFFNNGMYWELLGFYETYWDLLEFSWDLNWDLNGMYWELLLVGGLEHVLFSPIIGMMIQPDELIFFRGVETTN